MLAYHWSLRRLAVKEAVEALPEVTFTSSESDCQFTLSFVARCLRLGAHKMSDLEEEQHLVPCIITMQEDWSQVINVEVSFHQTWGTILVGGC